MVTPFHLSLLFLGFVRDPSSVPYSFLSTLMEYLISPYLQTLTLSVCWWHIVFKALLSFSDFTLFQTDLNLISSHISSKLLALNPSKCKNVFLLQALPLYWLTPLSIDFKQSVWKSWILPVPRCPPYPQPILVPTHSQDPTKKLKVLGIIYRHSYKFSTLATLLRLYISLVWPILDYCAPEWSPSSASLTHSLESVESFALKITSKFGQVLLPNTSQNLTPLSTYHQHSQLLLLFKMFHSYTLFPAPVLQHCPCPPYLIWSFHCNNFLLCFCGTSSFSKSFFPSTIHLWNSLPLSLKDITSLSVFSAPCLTSSLIIISLHKFNRY